MPWRTSIRTSPRRDRDLAAEDHRRLRPTLRDVARVVADPNGQGSVYSEWRRASAVADTSEPAMGDPGGGSDFAGFYNHLGIPIAEWGFGGAGGVYHSQYDSYAWMTKFGDTGFTITPPPRESERRCSSESRTRIFSRMTTWSTRAPIRRYIAPIDSAVTRRRWTAPTTSLRASIDRLEREACCVQCDEGLGAGGLGRRMPRCSAQTAR